MTNKILTVTELDNGFLVTTADMQSSSAHWCYQDDPAGWVKLIRKVFNYFGFATDVQREVAKTLLEQLELLTVSKETNSKVVQLKHPFMDEEVTKPPPASA